MSMTRKEFLSAADQLAEWSNYKRFTKQEVIIEFIKFFQSERTASALAVRSSCNPNFDAQRFAAACRHPASTFGAEDSQ